MKKAVFWFAYVVFSVSFLFFHPPQFDTDILKLVSDSQFELVSKAFKNNVLRFAFVGSSSSSKAAEEFKKLLPAGLKIKSEQEFENNIEPAYFLTQKQQEIFLAPGAVGEITQQIVSKLSSPLSSFYSRFLSIDPLLLIPDKILEINKKVGFRIENEILIKNDKTSMLIVETASNVSRADQQILVKQIEERLAIIRKNFPDLDIRWSGMLRFANSSANKMEYDLNIISTMASVLTTALVIFCFRSFVPLILSILAVFTGILGGLFTVVLYQGNIHLLTLGFGCSLLGACVDYPIHYFCAKQFENNKNVILPISLGALTTALSFVILLFSGFNGLIEISLFSVGSIFASWATVYCLFPVITYSKQSADPFSSFCIYLSRWISKYGVKLYPLLCVVSIVGAFNFKINDDIRLLQPADKKLIEDEKWMQEKTDLGMPNGFVFVSGETEEKLSQNLEKYSEYLKHLQKNKDIRKFEGKFSILPSKSEQDKSLSTYKFFLENNKQDLISELDKIGYEKHLIDKIFKIQEYKEVFPLAYDLGQIKDKFWSFIQVYGAREPQSLKGIFEENGFYYDHVAELSKIFEKYHLRSFYLILFSYFVIFSWVCLRYGVTLGARNFMPTVFSAILTLTFLSMLGVEFNFFGLLALIIVLGLTIDYSIFYLEGEHKIIPTSILLSSVSTIITFGLLGFSSTPVLANFGLIVATGIFFALFLTYLPFCENAKCEN